MPGIYTGQIAWRPIGNIGDCQALEGKARVGIQWLFEQIQQCGANQAYGSRSQRWVVDGSVITAWVVQTPLGQRSAWCEIYVPGSSKPPVLIQFEFLEDYVCGVVTAKNINEATQDGPATIKGLVETVEGERRVELEKGKRKLAVPLPASFATLADTQAQMNGAVLSQYTRIRPGNYTGYMRQLVQLLLGVGVAQELTFEESLVTSGMFPVPQTNADASSLAAQPRYPATTAVTYDYRFFKTNGVTWSTDGVCYVIQIGMGGVFAKPLQVHPTSLTPGGRARYQRLYPELFVPDISEKCLFDLFGGFPAESGFPTTTNLTKAVNAGDVVRLLTQAEMGDFYSKSAYSNTFGWAFHPTNQIAVNTCWSSHASGIKKGYLYNLMWEIGEWKEPDWRDSTRGLAGRFSADSAQKIRKIRRMSDEQVDQVNSLLNSKPENPDEEWTKNFDKAFDDIEVEPVVKTKAKLNMQQEGWLYHPAKFQATGRYCFGSTGHPQFKVPDEDLGFNLSFNFGPDEKSAKPPKSCDTPIWACWVRDQLFVVSYFWRPNPVREEPSSDTRGECQFTGTWSTSTPETRVVEGNFYSNMFDYRREVCTAGSSVTTTEGKWAGTADWFQFCAFFEMQCAIVRNVFASYIINNKSTESAGWSAGLAVPFGDRSVIYGASLSTVRGAFESTVYGAPVGVGTTGYTRYGEIYQWTCHWRNSCGYGYGRTPLMTNNRCVMWELVPMSVSPSCLSEFGPPEFPHYQPCESNPYGSAFTNCALNGEFNRTVQDSEANTVETKKHDKAEWETKIYGDCALHGMVVKKGMVAGETIYEDEIETTPWWYITSPACDPPIYCRFNVSLNRWGNDIINYDNDLDPMETLHHGLPAEMRVGSQSVFTGYVSDEVFDYG